MSIVGFVQSCTAAWGLGELLFAVAHRARNTGAEARDRGSLIVLWIVITLAIMAGLRFRNVPFGRIPLSPLPMACIGLAIALAGVILRIVAIATLKRAFTVDVAIHSDQELV